MADRSLADPRAETNTPAATLTDSAKVLLGCDSCHRPIPKALLQLRNGLMICPRHTCRRAAVGYQWRSEPDESSSGTY
jgi:hypothetical protein